MFLHEEELKAKEYFKNFLRLQEDPNDYKLKIIVVAGKMGFGKSMLKEFLNWLVWNIPAYKGLVNCANMKDIRTLYNPAYKQYWMMPIQFLNFDDAAYIFDAYEFMKNRKETQSLFDLRHIYEKCEYGTRGVIFMLVNIQTLRRIDVNIRDTYDVLIFKNYFDTKWFREKIQNYELIEFMREHTENASALWKEQEKRFCIGRTLTRKEFRWAVPIEDYDPEFGVEGGLFKIKDLLRKYNVMHTFEMDTMEDRILGELRKDLRHDPYYDLKNVKQNRAWLRNRAKLYDIDKYHINFTRSQFNEVIEDVSALRFKDNLDRKEEFTNFIRRSFSIDPAGELYYLEFTQEQWDALQFYEFAANKKNKKRSFLDYLKKDKSGEISFVSTKLEDLVLFLKRMTSEKMLFFFKNSELKNLLNEIKLMQLFNTFNKELNSDDTQQEGLDPTEKTVKDRMMALMRYVKPIWSIKELDGQLDDLAYDTIAVTLSHNTDTFTRYTTGTYHLKGYSPTEIEAEQYLPKSPKMLEMED